MRAEAARPRAYRKPSSEASVSRWLARSCASPALKRRPISLLAISSGFPPIREATTAQPHAIASMREFESASEDDGSTKISIFPSQPTTSDEAGSKRQDDATPSAAARARNKPSV